MRLNNIKPAIAPLFLIFLGIFLIASFPLIQHLQNNEKLLLDNPSEYAANEIKEISAQEAKLLHEKGLAVFLDVSPLQDFKKQHIVGAVNIPISNLEQELATLNHKNWIIVYSSAPELETTVQAGNVLVQNGFSRVNSLGGGFANWKTLGYPIFSQP